MQHPLRESDHRELRKKFFNFIKTSLTIPEGNNIIFVCGGNKKRSMRKCLQKQFNKILPKFHYFEPELALEYCKKITSGKQSNLIEFEELIANLAHSVIIFPEAPGSFAEIGSFSKTNCIAEKTLSIIDSKYQEDDESFLALGPIALINTLSVFKPAIYIDYKKPNFSILTKRIRRKPLIVTRNDLDIKKFKQTNIFEQFSIIQFIVDFLRIATINDIEFFMHGFFGSDSAPTKIQEIIAILKGAGYLYEVKNSEYKHLARCKNYPLILKVRDSETIKNTLTRLKTELSTVLSEHSDDVFQNILKEAQSDS